MFKALKLIPILTIAIVLSACELEKAEEPIVKLYVFECGDHLFKDISAFSPGVDVGVAKTLTNSCYLIKHKNGNLLWDTGLNDDIGPKGIDAWNGGLHLSVKNPLMKQLKEIDVRPEDIKYLGISHFHFDHTGNANNFPNAVLLVQKEEYAAAYGKEPEKYFFDPKTYNKIDKSKAITFQGDHDVFSDGRVIIKRAIGHTPGHQVLYVKLKKTGGIVLSGDLVHFTKNWEHRRIPSFNFDKEESKKSMDKIAEFVKEEKAQLWIQHDKEQNAGIKHAPNYYQ